MYKESKYIALLRKSGLKRDDDALLMKNLMLGSFSYPTRSFHNEKSGVLIRGKNEFIVKWEDVPAVLNCSTYKEGLIVMLSYFKKVDHPGGYDLQEVDVVEFPAEFPASLNDTQLSEFLSNVKKNKRKNYKYIINYFEENDITSFFFANKIRNILNDLNIPHMIMSDFNDLCEGLHNADLKRFIDSEDDSRERSSVIRKAGL